MDSNQEPLQNTATALLQQAPSMELTTQEVVPRIAEEWHRVGMYCEITLENLEVIKTDAVNPIDCCSQMFETWLRKAPGTGDKLRTWDTLLYAVQMGHGKQASEDIQLVLEQATATKDKLATPADKWPQEAFLLQKRAYDAYRAQELTQEEGSKANYVKLAVLESEPSFRPDKAKMSAVQGFKNCGNRAASENAAEVTYADLLKKADRRIRVVYGQAGSGKTTMLRQMCKALSNKASDCDFPLVLKFELRDKSISGAKDLQGLLMYYLQDERPEVASFLENWMKDEKGKGILLVFDGADEVKDLLKAPSGMATSGCVIQRILEGLILPDAQIIVSSRPGACPLLQRYNSIFYEVLGFDRAAIDSYVEDFFRADRDAAQRMLLELKNRPDLLGAAYIPMNLFILCSIFEQRDSSFPATLTACYHDFNCDILAREYRRLEGREPDLDCSIKSMPSDIQSLLCALGVLAFEGLTQNPPQFIFEQSAICSSFSIAPGTVISTSLFKGLLNHYAGRKGAYRISSSYTFSHATRQEFFAALHLSQMTEVEQAEFWKENLFNETFAVVLRFYAGLTRLENRQVADQICCAITGATEGGSTPYLRDTCTNANPQLLHACYSLHESQNEALIKRAMKTLPKSLTFAVKWLTSFDTMVISRCLCHCDHLEKLDPGPLLSANCLADIKAVFEKNEACQLGGGLYLDCDYFEFKDAQTLSQLVAVSTSLKSLILRVQYTECAALSIFCSIGGVTDLGIIVRSGIKDDSGWHEVAASLAVNCDVQELGLDGCDAFLTNMASVLTGNLSIPKHLTLWRQGPMPNAVACALGTSVAAMNQLQVLRMYDLPLPILKALAERKDPLEKLYIFQPGVNWNNLNEDQWKEAEIAATNAKVKWVWLEISDKSRWRSETNKLLDEKFKENKVVQAVEPSHLQNRKMKNQ